MSLPSNLEIQTPGVIPEHVFQALEPIIDKMDEPKKYEKPDVAKKSAKKGVK